MEEKKGTKWFIKHAPNTARDPALLQLIGKHGGNGYLIYWALLEHLWNLWNEQNGFISIDEIEAIAPTCLCSLLCGLQPNDVVEIIETCIELHLLETSEEESKVYSPLLMVYRGRMKKTSETNSLAGLKSWEARKAKQKVNDELTTIERPLNERSTSVEQNKNKNKNKSKNKSKNKTNTNNPYTYTDSECSEQNSLLPADCDCDENILIADEDDSTRLTEYKVILEDGSYYYVNRAELELWIKSYPDVDVPQQLRRIECWNDAHVKERKKRTGIRKHIIGWLNKEQKDATMQKSAPRPQGKKELQGKSKWEGTTQSINPVEAPACIDDIY